MTSRRNSADPGITDRVYLDHAATTPLRPEALEAMLPVLTAAFANPSGAHAESRRARLVLDDAGYQKDNRC